MLGHFSARIMRILSKMTCKRPLVWMNRPFKRFVRIILIMSRPIPNVKKSAINTPIVCKRPMSVLCVLLRRKIDIPESRKDDFRREIMNYIGALGVGRQNLLTIPNE